jgi:hypothetical protein
MKRMNSLKRSTILVAVIITTGLLTAMSVMLARSVSSSLNLTRVASDRVRVYSQLRNDLVDAVGELKRDKTPYDCRLDAWAQFDRVRVIDETARLNINTVSPAVLEELLIASGIGQSRERAGYIAAWRGDNQSEAVPEDAFDYYRYGYECKRAAFESVHELELVKGFDTVPLERLEALKRLITVYGNGRININTVESDVLTVLIRSCARELNVTDKLDPIAVAQRLVSFPVTEERVFVHSSLLVSRSAEIFDPADLTPALAATLRVLQSRITSESSIFRLEAGQTVPDDGYPALVMTWVFDREMDRVLFQYQQ